MEDLAEMEAFPEATTSCPARPEPAAGPLHTDERRDPIDGPFGESLATRLADGLPSGSSAARRAMPGDTPRFHPGDRPLRPPHRPHARRARSSAVTDDTPCHSIPGAPLAVSAIEKARRRGHERHVAFHHREDTARGVVLRLRDHEHDPAAPAMPMDPPPETIARRPPPFVKCRTAWTAAPVLLGHLRQSVRAPGGCPGPCRNRPRY